MADVAAAHIAVRFTPSEKASVHAAATHAGFPTVSGYIRHLLDQAGALAPTAPEGGTPC